MAPHASSRSMAITGALQVNESGLFHLGRAKLFVFPHTVWFSYPTNLET